jgi:phosphoribosyl-AMP cyclohydrolase
VPCILQDATTGEVLMVAYADAEAMEATVATGEAHFWSRRRRELWHKGATSGNIQRVVELRVDCDQDAVLMRVRVDGHGATCHTGRVSCFYRAVPLGQDARTGPVRLEFVGDERRFDPETVYGRS